MPTTAATPTKSVTPSVTPDPKKKKADKTPKEVKVVKGNGKVVKVKKEVKRSDQSEALVSYDPFSSQVQVGRSVKDLIKTLPKLNQEQLIGMFRNTVDAERAMFVVRGATAHELIKRAIAEGKKFDKSKGGGVDTMINEIAKDVGIDGKTLYADYKVFEEFGEWLIEQLTTAPDTIMPREFYVLAMKTTTMAIEPPSEILSYFQEQRESTGGYFTDHARRDTKLFNEGKSIEQVIKLDQAERKQKISDKGKKTPSVPADKMASIQIVASEKNIAWVKLIMKKYSSFNAWFEKRCKDEFGEPEESK